MARERTAPEARRTPDSWKVQLVRSLMKALLPEVVNLRPTKRMISFQLCISSQDKDAREAISTRDGRVGERVREEVERADEGHAGVVAGLHRTDETDGAAGDECVLGEELVGLRVEAVRRRARVEDVGQERLAADLVADAAVEQRGAGLRRQGDERRGGAGEREHECRMRAVVELGVVGEVVDDPVAAVVKLDVELARKVAPVLAQVGREHDEDVARARDVRVQALWAQVRWESCRDPGQLSGLGRGSLAARTFCRGCEEDEVVEAQDVVLLEDRLGC